MAQDDMEVNDRPDIMDYKLPITDVQVEKRNFPGYSQDQFVTLDDLQQKGSTPYTTNSTGTTETDKVTGASQKGYTMLNKIDATKLAKRWQPKTQGS